MADVQIATQLLSTTEVAPVFTTLNAVDVYYVPNNTMRTILYFKNTNAGVCTVTFDVTQTIEGLTIADHTISIPATTGERIVGHFVTRFEFVGGTNDKKLKFTQNLATGVTVAAFNI
jgi:hypothetical protein